jgi:hypothetical protein
MYSYDDRIRAVELYIKLGKRVAPTIRQLGYPLGSRPQGTGILTPTGFFSAQLMSIDHRIIRDKGHAGSQRGNEPPYSFVAYSVSYEFDEPSAQLRYRIQNSFPPSGRKRVWFVAEIW